MADDKPIIIIKKKGGHGGHHGGAWKVAYADFVTAMMAFFMVMWLLNSADKPTKASLAAYFRDPGIFEHGSGTPLMIGDQGILNDAYRPPPPGKRKTTGEGKESLKNRSGPDNDAEVEGSIEQRGEKAAGFIQGDESSHGFALEAPDNEFFEDTKKEKSAAVPQPGETGTNNSESGRGDKSSEATAKESLEKVAEEIRQQIAASPELQEMLGMVDIKVDADGLNIEIMDTEKSSMFESGMARVLPQARLAFAKLTGILAKLPNEVDIVGHTDAKPFSSRADGYSNWELSSDRANAARRLMIAEGIPMEKITSVTGRADKDLKNTAEPLAAANRRITLKVKFPINKKIDLAKEPDALSKVSSDATMAPEKIQTPAPKPTVHSLTAQEVLELQERKKKKNIKLPEEEGPKKNPDFMEKDKIFGDNPVIGPRTFFNDAN